MNFIVIVSDTFRRDHLGCYHNHWIRTPNLDRFAGESMVFDRAYTGSFPTVPHRAELLTGRFVFTYYDWSPLPKDEVVLAQALGEAGYVTMMVADTPHILKNGYNFDRGFSGWVWVRGQENDRYATAPIDVELPCSSHKLRNPEGTVKQYLRNVSLRRHEGDYFVAATMTKAAQWLERNYEQEKFFLYVDTFDPHEPWDPPQWYVDLYDPGYEGEEVIYPAYGPCDYLSEAELRHVRALYAGEVTLVDRWVGMLLRKVKDLGLLDNTAIFFTTDHGFYLGEHGLIGKAIIRGKAAQAIPLYEEMIRIPLIIRPPKAKSGRRCDALVQPADIMPTILDLAGVKDPETMHGKSLVPLLIRKKRSLRESAVSSWSIIRGLAAWRPSTITMDEWALIYGGRWAPREGYPTTQVVDSISRTERAFVGEKEPELYHLPSDPKQEKNVFAENKDVARRLHAEYIKFLQSVGTPEEYLRGRKEL